MIYRLVFEDHFVIGAKDDAIARRADQAKEELRHLVHGELLLEVGSFLFNVDSRNDEDHQEGEEVVGRGASPVVKVSLCLTD